MKLLLIAVCHSEGEVWQRLNRPADQVMSVAGGDLEKPNLPRDWRGWDAEITFQAALILNTKRRAKLARWVTKGGLTYSEF